LQQGESITDHTMPMRCIQCGAADLEERKIELAGSVRDESHTVRMRGLACPNCDYQTIDGSAMPEYARLLSDEYRAAHNLLTSDELRTLRERLGMSQAKFADYLGVGVASVKRWEMGRIQESAMDELIRLKTEPEAARRNLKTVEAQVPEHLVVSGNEDLELEMVLETSYLRPKQMKIDRSGMDFTFDEEPPLAA
jgi:putative zinc finger/helix-turn-helix YgiT family protein